MPLTQSHMIRKRTLAPNFSWERKGLVWCLVLHLFREGALPGPTESLAGGAKWRCGLVDAMNPPLLLSTDQRDEKSKLLAYPWGEEELIHASSAPTPPRLPKELASVFPTGPTQ